MRNLRIFASLTAMLFLASSALPQTADSHPATKNGLPPQVVVARCAYTQTDDVCASANGNTLLAQMPRRMPDPPFRGRAPLRGPAYPRMWRSEGSPAHALIGTIIGFGLGAAVGAKGNIGVRGTLAFGFIGAGIGFSVPSFPSRYKYRHPWPDNDPDNDEEASVRKSAKPGPNPPASSQQTASSNPQPSKPLPDAEDRVSPAVAAP